MPDPNTRFCGYPSAFICKDPAGKGVKNLAKHLFWGDTVQLDPAGEVRDGWRQVSSRDVTGWIKESDLQRDPLLDIIFLDVGQGDSCFIVTPDDQRIIVDAGPGDNLVRYMRWRYRRFETDAMKAMGGTIKAFILSHPDADHYGGLASLFDEKRLGTAIQVGTFYHNGLFPRSGAAFDAAFDNERVGKNTYLTPVRDLAELDAFLTANQGRLNEFSALVADIRRRCPATDFQMLHADAPTPGILGAADGLSVDILWPALACNRDGAPRLPAIARDIGVSKNGNSVVMAIRYRDIRILLSGDINEKAEQLLLGRYQATPDALAAEVFKAPHHGSSDFLDQFLADVSPVVSVVSSGDNEGYSHPRADTLGSLGKKGRGERPLIFSTELGRSLRIETAGTAAPKATARRAGDPVAAPATAATTDAETAKDRVVAVYGAINLRTDGRKLLMCQKKEAPDSKGREWDLYPLEPRGAKGTLTFVPVQE